MPFDLPPVSGIHRSPEDPAKAAKQIAEMQKRAQVEEQRKRAEAIAAEARRKASETSKGR